MGARKYGIGVSLPRVDGRDKARGATRFVGDRVFARMLHAYPVFSPVSHGTLKGADTSAAEREPGFVAAFFAADVPGENRVGVIFDDQPLFADRRVRYVGDAVGVAVAETEQAAWRAAKAVELEIEPLPAVHDIGACIRGEAPLLHEDRAACRHRVDLGDAPAELARAPRVVEGTLRTPWQEHFYLEPQGCIAEPGDDGGMTIHGSIQCVFYVQKAVARALGLPLARVRVVQTPIGGAFGGKEDIPSEVCARAAVAAWALKRPVRMLYRRRDDIQATSKRHPAEMHYRVGVDDEGRLLAAEVRIDLNAGAYATLSSVVSYRAAMQALGPYRVPHVKVRSTAWYTNTPPNGAFRGFGSPQATFGHERMMDRIARELNLDPVEFRLRNVLREGSRTSTGQRLVQSVGAEAVIRRGAEDAGWDRTPRASGDGRYRYGIGIAACHYGNCLGAAGWAMDGAAAKIQIRRDGSVTAAYGLVDMGQGANTVVAQMTAEALGLDPARVTVLPTDTLNVPDSGPSVASRNVVMTGNAIRDAAGRLVGVMRRAAAAALGVEADQVVIARDGAQGPGGGRTLPFEEVAELMFLHNLPMDALGWWHVPELEYDADTGVGEAYFTYSYAAHVAKVRVDTVTGRVRVETVWAAHDVGRAIHPAGLEGQVEGGVAQGVGWALYENFRLDDGRVMTGNLSTYLVPTAMDVPEVHSRFVEEPDDRGPWGAKGIGEPAIIPTGAAVANALSHALGVEVDEIPVTPERVLGWLDEAAIKTGGNA